MEKRFKARNLKKGGNAANANSIDKIKIELDGREFYWYGEVNERGQADGKGELYNLDETTLRVRGLTEIEINRIATGELIFSLGGTERAIQSFREHTEKYIVEREKRKKLVKFDNKTLNMVFKNGELYTCITFTIRGEPLHFYYEGKRNDLMAEQSIFDSRLDLEQYLGVNSNNTKNSSFLSRARKCVGNTCSYVAKKAFNMIRRPDDRPSELYNKSGEKIYLGQVKNGIREGSGSEFNPKTGKEIFYGDFKNNLRDGKGYEYNQKYPRHSPVTVRNGRVISTEYIYEGEYKNGFRHGDGKEYTEDGELVFEGEWKNGKPYQEKSLGR